MRLRAGHRFLEILRSPAYLLGLGVGVFEVALFAGGLHLFSTHGLTVFPSTAIACATGLLLCASSFVTSRRHSWRFEDFTWALLLILALVVFSDFPHRLRNSFHTQWPVAETLAAGSLAYLLLRLRPRWFLPALFACGVMVGLGGFLQEANGRLIFSDDHPCFLFRLEQLKRNFPFIPYYSSLWNGGYEAREFFPSGVLNVFFIFSPLIYLFDVTALYNFIVLGVIFGLAPLSTFCAARILQLSYSAAWIAAIITLYPSLYWYRWALSYGTMGFLTAVTLMPLVIAQLAKACDTTRHFTPRDCIVFCTATCLMLFWSLSTAALLPLVLLILWHSKTLLRKPLFILSCVLIFALSLPWMLVFLKASNVGQFVQAQPKDAASNEEGVTPAQVNPKIKAELQPFTAKGMLARVREYGTSMNPLVAFLALPAIFFLPRGTRRFTFLLLLPWLLLLGSWVSFIKPQLELDRMLIVFAFLAAIPVGNFLTVAFSHSIDSWKRIPRWAGAICASGLLALVPWRSYQVVSNETIQRYHFAAPYVAELRDIIRQHANGGRTLFAGFILHELSQGHVAPLPVWTGVPMIAASYQHNMWHYTDVIPRSFRDRKKNGILEYLESYNVSLIVAHENKWKHWYRAQKKLFIEVGKAGPFVVFARRQFVADYFLQGSGTLVSERESKISLIPAQADVIIKFTYLPFLESSSCRILPAQIAEGVQFIELRDCVPGEQVHVRARPFWKRLVD